MNDQPTHAFVTEAHYATHDALYRLTVTGMHPSTPEGRLAGAQLIANAQSAPMLALIKDIEASESLIAMQLKEEIATLRAALAAAAPVNEDTALLDWSERHPVPYLSSVGNDSGWTLRWALRTAKAIHEHEKQWTQTL